jgi:hypothetical protein
VPAQPEPEPVVVAAASPASPSHAASGQRSGGPLREAAATPRRSAAPAAETRPGFVQRTVARLFGGASESHTAAPAAAAAPSSVVEMDTFTAYLAEAVRSGKPASASRIQLIGLDGLKTRLGDGWPKVAQRADEIARRTIQSRLGRTDVFTALQGWKYLILFPELTVGEAKLKSAMIAEEIARAILGDAHGPGAIEVKSAIVSADGALTFETAPSLEDLTLRMAEETARARPAVSDKPALPELPPAPAIASDALEVMSVWYRPVFDARQRLVVAAEAVPVFDLPGGLRAVGEGRVLPPEDEEAYHRLDVLMLTQAILALNAAAVLGRPRLISLGIGFETLAVAARRMDYLRRLDSVLWPARQKIVFKIRRVPDGATPSRLHELVMALKRHARAITLEMPVGTDYVWNYQDLALHAIGVELGEGGPQGEALLSGMARFARRGRKAGFDLFADGLGHRAQVEAAIADGYRYLTGDGIGPAVRTLAEIRQSGIAADMPAPPVHGAQPAMAAP